MSRDSGVWLRGWDAAGERVAVWRHKDGPCWAWECDLRNTGRPGGAWTLTTSPTDFGCLPPKVPNQIPSELSEWVMEPQMP